MSRLKNSLLIFKLSKISRRDFEDELKVFGGRGFKTGDRKEKMKKDYIPLGPTPPSEDCAQSTDPLYAQKSNNEIEVWRDQIERTFPDEIKTGIEIKKMGFAHDFGKYYECVIIYDTENEKQVNAAFHIDNNLPTEWDRDAKRNLELANRILAASSEFSSKKNPQTAMGDVAVLQQCLVYLNERPETARELPSGVLRFFIRRGFWKDGLTKKGKDFVKVKYNPLNKARGLK